MGALIVDYVRFRKKFPYLDGEICADFRTTPMYHHGIKHWREGMYGVEVRRQTCCRLRMSGCNNDLRLQSAEQINTGWFPHGTGDVSKNV